MGQDLVERLPEHPDFAGLLDALAYDADGLVTVVAQDAANGEVLMVAHANREALELSAATGQMHYYSRSRNKLWRKGEVSGHTQRLLRLSFDCDGDAVVAQVEQVAGACHLGYRSCFANRWDPAGGYVQAGRKVFDPQTKYGRA